MRMIRRMVVIVIVLAVIQVIALAQGTGSISYFYDDVGRLIKVVDQNGNVASYSYDTAGNLVGITRSTLPSNNGLAILNFTPQNGPIGQTVTILGQGFSTTVSSNAVKFNGVSAVVSAATATSLTVTVPAGASTGLVSVTVGGNSANSDTNFTVTSVLTSIAVTPSTTSINAAGQQQQFTATGTYADGSQRNITAAAMWSSSNTTAAVISNTSGNQGLVTSVGVGVTTIGATSGSVTGSTTLTVNGFPLTVTPASVSFYNTATQQFTATGTINGTSQNVTNSVYWSSSDPTVASVSNIPGGQGVATNAGYGITNICASLPGSNAQMCARLTILPTLKSISVSPTAPSLAKGQQLPLTATGAYTDGSFQDLTKNATWTSSNPAVATLSDAPGSQGLVTAVAVGISTITAASGSISNSTVLTVTAAVPVSLSVSPSTDSVQPNSSVQYVATLIMSDGTNQDVTQTATWNSSQPNVATINNQGLATAAGAGSATITATSGSFSGTATLLVSNGGGTVFPRVLYAANNDGTVSIYTVNGTNGQLRPNGYIDAGGYFGFSAALDPSSRHLYVATELGLKGYAVNATNGALTEITGSPFSSTSSFGIAVHPTSGFLYTADGGSSGTGTVSAYAIGSDGALTSAPGSPFTVGGFARDLVIDPSGKLLYVMVNNGGTASGAIYAFTIDTNSGNLSPTPGSPFTTGTNPDAIVLDPSGKFLYVANFGQDFGSRQFLPFDRGNRDLYARLPFWPNSFNSTGTTANKKSIGGWNESVKTIHDDTPVLLASAALANGLPFGFSPHHDSLWGLSPRLKLFLQSGNVPDPSISIFDIDPASGALTEISGSPLVLPNRPTTVVVDKSGKYVYVPLTGGISGFAIDPSTGGLSQLADSPYSGTPSKLVADPSGQFLYGSGVGISVFAIASSTGTLTPLGIFPARQPQALAIASGPAAITFVPQFAYAASAGPSVSNPNGANSISAYSVDPAGGGLTPVLGSPFSEGFSPTSLVFDPGGASLYVANNCSDASCVAGTGSVSAYNVDATTGGLTGVSGAPFLAGSNPTGAVVDPSGRFVYVLNQATSSISGYGINLPGGALAPLPGSPYPVTGFTPMAIAMDQMGLGLIVSGCTGTPCTAGTVVPYGISSSGALTTFYTFSAGISGSSVAMDPTANFVVVADGVSNAVSVFSASPAYTAGYYLTPVTGSPFATGQTPLAVGFDPTGTFVYVANQSSNNISAYTIDPTAGTLTQVSGSPFPCGTSPTSLAVDYSGKFLYVTNNLDNTVAVFAINPSSGGLTVVSGSPFPVGTAPVSVVTTGKTQ